METSTSENGATAIANEELKGATQPNSVKKRIENLLTGLNEGVYEKEEPIRLALLSAIAGESIFLLGLPGVAKSLIARRLKFAFKDATAFEYLMNRFSTPDEIFGPVSVKKLTESDEYLRITDKYLPDADIVFLDEIWKAGPSIQNTLLTVLNEKIFRNGKEVQKVKLKGLIAASNELPALSDDNRESLDALWDRFLIRLVVSGIQDKEKFNEMIRAELNPDVDNIKDDLKITNDEYEQWAIEISSIQIPEEVFKVIDVIRKNVQKRNESSKETMTQFYISDRRWKKAIRVLRCAAFLNSRKEVDLMDCFLIADIIWGDVSEIGAMKDIVSEAIRNYGYTLMIDIDLIRNQIKAFDKEVKDYTVNYVKPIEKKLKEIKYKNDIYYNIVNVDPSQNILPNISKTDFDGLGQSDKTVYLLDSKTNKTVERKYVQKGDDAFSIKIDLNNNSQYRKYQLEINDLEKITKKPNKHTIVGWNQDVENIKSEIAKQLATIQKHREEKLFHLQNNLFIESTKANIVEENLHNTIQELNNLNLEIDKIKDYYDNLE